MPAESLLDFEEPIAVLLKEVDALELLPHTEHRVASPGTRRRSTS